jgi:hypothetical protein
MRRWMKIALVAAALAIPGAAWAGTQVLMDDCDCPCPWPCPFD